MATLTQANRQFKVTTTLGADVLLFGHMAAEERLSGLYRIDLNLFSENKSIKPDQIVGTPVCVAVGLPDQKGERYFHGLCSRFDYVENLGTINVYRATLRPWLWFLTLTADCRIFQKQTTPQIITSVFRDHGFTDFRDALTRTYEAREYCVQYRETAFNFVSRLMEQEGIYYYHEHAQGKHTLVLADATSCHGKTSGYDKVPFFPPEQSGRRKRDHISQWSMAWEAQPGEYTHTDYDFKKPGLDLKAHVSQPRSHGHAKGEIYDYPSLYLTPDAGGSVARIRMDELRAGYQVASGVGDVRGLKVGSIFTLTDYPRDDQNHHDYLVTSTKCVASSNDYTTGGSAAEDSTFDCSFTAISSAEQFRPRRVTPKPFVQGPQTALVVGPAGEEIHTDEYGRIMVQFYWDRLGKKNQDSSCWIRVGQLWASSGWGAMFIPRINMEVIVDFLEGDPDRPIVTGCVYNGNNKPPYPLPGEKTKSTIKSNSSKGGGGSNEMRFEDKKGSEEIYIHAQKDRNLVIEHDETKTVGNDRKKDIKHDETSHIFHDRTETVDNNETITIGANRTETVQKDESITINGARTETVAKDETITINGARTETVAKDETISINGGRTETVAKDETISINGGRTETVAKDENITINGGRTESIAKDESVSVTGGRTVSIGKDDSQSVGKKLTISAGDEITIACGSATIQMKKNGDIIINGNKINVTGSGDVTIKGSKILQN